MDAGHCADEPAVGHVGEGGEVGVLAAGGGNGATTFDPCFGFALVWVGRVICERRSVSYRIN